MKPKTIALALAAASFMGCYSIPDAQNPPVYSGDTPETFFDRTGFQVVWSGNDFTALQSLRIVHPAPVRIDRVRDIHFVAVEYHLRVQKQDKETIKEDFRNLWMKSSRLPGPDPEAVTPAYLCEEPAQAPLRGMCVDEARVVLPEGSPVKIEIK